MGQRDLGSRIRAARERVGRNRNQMARDLGTSWQHVDRWERGVTEPSPESLRKLAAYLEVSVDHLLGASQAPPAPQPPGRGFTEFLGAYAPADLSGAEAAWLRAAPVDHEQASPGDYVNMLHGLRQSASGPDRLPPPKSGRQAAVRWQDVSPPVKNGGKAT